MQTDILLKQLHSTLAELRIAIDKFEKHPSPSTHYAEQLHVAIFNSSKLVSAYLVIKEHKDVSPDINLHMKLMNVPTKEEKPALVEPIKETIAEPAAEMVIEPVKIEVKPIEIVKEPIVEKQSAPLEELKLISKEFPKIAISINDKFRFINELFGSNANEYHIAVEQMNAVNSVEEMTNYMNGLKSIYEWDDDTEVVKNLHALARKRFS